MTDAREEAVARAIAAVDVERPLREGSTLTVDDMMTRESYRDLMHRFARAAIAALPTEEALVEAPRWTSAIPMIRRPNGNWSKVHYNRDGTLGADVKLEEADAVAAWRFYLLNPNSDQARTLLTRTWGTIG